MRNKNLNLFKKALIFLNGFVQDNQEDNLKNNEKIKIFNLFFFSEKQSEDERFLTSQSRWRKGSWGQFHQHVYAQLHSLL